MKLPASSRKPVLIGLGLLSALVLGGLWLIFSYLDLERERDLADWRIRLALIADNRAADLDNWLAQQFASLQELSNNASLQLYLSQLLANAGSQEIEPAQLGYLRNLINAAAERAGFRSLGEAEPVVRANLPMAGSRGLALLNTEGQTVVATSGMPMIDADDRKRVEHAISTGKPTLRDLHIDASGQALIGFMVPVAAVQGLQGEIGQRLVGVLYGVKPAASELFPLLANRGALTPHDETLLIRAQDDMVVYLAPLADGSAPTKRRLARNTPDLAGAHALRAPGEFAQLLDYRGIPVLMTSRALTGAPWVLVQKTDAAEALRESNDHRRFLLTAFLLTLFFIAASLIAAWRHGSSVRAEAMAGRLQEKTRLLEGQSRLLHGVTDTLSDYLFLIDEGRRLLFANRALESALGVAQADLVGKTLASVFGPDAAHRVEACLRERGGLATAPAIFAFGEQQGLFQCSALPLPNPAGSGHAILVVLHDVTALHESERKRAVMFHQLIASLMRAVDKHDPYSANHSSRTAAVAAAIGRELKLPPTDLQALDLAANLANVGKIFIPKEILTKTDALSGAEQETLKQHVQYALDILSSLEFEGPVLETIAQKQELMDGSGYPHGLRDGDIILTARILAVANAFVALVSPRAYRDAVPIAAALDQLLTESKDKYDRHVVAALFHIAENSRELADVTSGA